MTTTDRDFDWIATAWLAEGPDELSDRVLDAAVDQIHLTRQRRAMRVPWRFPTMTTPARVATAAVIGVLAVGGAFLVFGKPGQPAVGVPSASPSPSPVASAPPAASPLAVESPSAATYVTPPLTRTYTSARNGYVISYPAGWVISPATEVWPTGVDLGWDPLPFDRIRTDEARIAAGSQPLQPGQTAAAWDQASCGCLDPSQVWEKVQIGGATGYRNADGGPPPFVGLLPDGVMYAAEVVSGGRGYQFVMDGHVDRAMFDAFLETVHFTPVEPIDLPALTGTFTSSTYGYSIGLAKGWTTKPATARWTGFADDAAVADQIRVTGTDTTVTIKSQPFPTGIALDTWQAQLFQHDAVHDLPADCAGGGPTTTALISIGLEEGKLDWYCNGAEASVIVQGRIYVLGWHNSSATTTDHLGFVNWSELLKSVALTPKSAK